jgi:transcriptional regulator GlxA family with amidase domain
MLKNVAAVVLDGFSPFELSLTYEVFGVDRSDGGLPPYEFAMVAAEPGPLRGDAGFTIDGAAGLDRLERADLVVVVPADEHVGRGPRQDVPPELLSALRRTVRRGARVLSVCSGAFVLGAAGLLDGRRCTTHWRYARDLARRHPAATVDPAVLYVDADPVITSAGSAAGIDACLYLIRKEQGANVANGIARRMVVPPHRDGGQAQYLERPLPDGPADTLAGILSWMERNLDQPMTVAGLAERAHMSDRTFARRFRQETGTTPKRWLTGQRVLLAQELLEHTDEGVDTVAARTGFGSAAVLRHHFHSCRDITPDAYRRTFRGRESGPVSHSLAG